MQKGLQMLRKGQTQSDGILPQILMVCSDNTSKYEITVLQVFVSYPKKPNACLGPRGTARFLRVKDTPLKARRFLLPRCNYPHPLQPGWVLPLPPPVLSAGPARSPKLGAQFPAAVLRGPSPAGSRPSPPAVAPSHACLSPLPAAPRRAPPVCAIGQSIAGPVQPRVPESG